MKQNIELYGEDSGYINTFMDLYGAYKRLQDLKKFDKENGIKDNYYFVIENTMTEIKIYKYKNKIKCKVVS